MCLFCPGFICSYVGKVLLNMLLKNALYYIKIFFHLGASKRGCSNGCWIENEIQVAVKVQWIIFTKREKNNNTYLRNNI